MSNKQNSLAEALGRLSKMNASPKSQNTKYWSAKEGRNDILILPQSADGHPFAEWFVHKGVIDPAKPWFAIACDHHNEGGECVICEMAQTLKEANYKGNETLWKVLEAVKEMYSPIIDLADIEAGIQWWSYGRSVSSQFELWLRNLEEEEKPFYDITAPQKVIVTYTKAAAPKDKYKLEKKNVKPIELEQYTEWFGKIKPIDEVRNNRKSAEEKEELLANFVKGKEAALKAVTVEKAPAAVAATPKPATSKKPIVEEVEEEEEVVIPSKKKSKLDTLKNED